MLLIRRAACVHPRRADTPTVQDVRCDSGTIVQVGLDLPARPGERVVEARGNAVIPGLHDHHLHLLALAAARASVGCGPPQVVTPEQLRAALSRPDGSGWVRGTGYHESVAGMLDRAALDALTGDYPVRVQHRTGKMWFVNTAAAHALRLDAHPEQPGIERDAAGRPTGRLFRADGWLRTQLGPSSMPDIGMVSQDLAGYGVTGFTDTSPSNDDSTAELFRAWANSGALLQRVRLMGSEALSASTDAAGRVSTGELKILLDEYELPDLDGLSARIRRAHAGGRAVAVHCVTRAELVFALAALREAGPAGDRIEHASESRLDMLPLLEETGVTVVTQPGFITDRGDQYRKDVPADRLDELYRCRSLLEHGIPLGMSSDAPYGNPDPWHAMRAAVERRTASGFVIGEQERLTPEAALAAFSTPADAPGGAPRVLRPGAPADLCVLSCSWADARGRLDHRDVAVTVRGGEVIFERP